MEPLVPLPTRDGSVLRSNTPYGAVSATGMELRQLCEAAGLITEQVAELLDCSHSKIPRIETGKVGATDHDVRDMIEIYRVTGEQGDALVEAATFGSRLVTVRAVRGSTVTWAAR